MVRDCGVTAEVHYDGLELLSLPLTVDTSSPRRMAATAARLLPYRRRFARFVERIAESDAIVAVANVPASFAKDSFPNLEILRRRLPTIPIINYDLHYLPTVDKWSTVILTGRGAGLTAEDMHFIRHGAFGMERYDWYLMASVVSHLPMHPPPMPFTLVGLNIDDGTLYPEQNGEVRALIDFAQPRLDYPSFRGPQMEALDRAGIPYDVLEGEYTMSEIRAIYRRTAIFLLASKESFGFPICELQACGSYIFMPHSFWAEAHWLKDDLLVPGAGRLSPNFCVYDNDSEKLVGQLLHVRETFDPSVVIETMKLMQPHLIHGDREALSGFLGMLDHGRVHAALHHQHHGVGR